MSARRRSAILGAVLAVALAAVGLAFEHARAHTMVRVGGAHNACACTQRIEP